MGDIVSRALNVDAGTSRALSLRVMQSAEILSPDSSPDGQGNVNGTERWISVVLGSAAAAYGLSRRSVGGVALAGLGGALLWRGASGRCPVYEALGITSVAEADGDRSNVSVPYGKGIRVEQSVTIALRAEEIYSFFRDFENLPRFLSHLKSVTVLDEKRSHWAAKGPAGGDAEWDAEIINEIPNELIGWRSVEGSQVDNAGSIHFKPAAGDRGTDVKVILRYDPPGGLLGAMTARIFGEDPAHQVKEDLRALKMLLETGEIATTDGQPNGVPSRARFRERLVELVR
jgi:uncharacterized membrane protein